MNYLLTQDTVWAIGSILRDEDTLYYHPDYKPPKYVIAFFESKGFHVTEKETRPIEYMNKFPRRKYDRYPTEEELNHPDFLKKKYIISDKNFIAVYSKLRKDNIVIYKELKSEYKIYLKSLRKLRLDIRNILDPEQVPPDAVCIKASSSFVPDETDLTNVDTLQYIYSENKDGTKNYRRFKLGNYLKEHCKVHIINNRNISVNVLDKKFKYLIASDCRGSSFLITKKELDGSILIYDRTDNWSALGEEEAEEEADLINAADIIFCSAQYLYDSLPDNCKSKAHIIFNGCDVKPYRPCEKFKKKTAVYAGRSSNKIEWAWIQFIAETNPDWDFRIYGVDLNHDISNLPNVYFYGWIPETELHEVLCKSHLGLVPFINSDWTHGMLPLKFFHYVNAHIPTFYINCNELAVYDKVAIDPIKQLIVIFDEGIPDIDNEEYEKILKDANWNEKFKKMLSIINNFEKVDK